MPLRFTHESYRRWLARAGATIFALVLLYPHHGVVRHTGPWQWGQDVRALPYLSRVACLFC